MFLKELRNILFDKGGINMKEIQEIAEMYAYWNEDSILPARAVAYRKDGSKIEAGDKQLHSAVITLMSMINKERLPKIILKQLLTIKDRINDEIFAVL